MKTRLVVVSFALMTLSLVAAYYCPSPFGQALGINIGTSFMSLGVALLFVNIYLERSSRRGAVRSLFVLSHQSIAGFHNRFLELCWAKFGRDNWNKALNEYVSANGEPTALRQEVRDYLYELAKTNKDIQGKLERLADTLTELSRLVGWDLDSDLLEACLDSRIAIHRLRDIDYNDSDEAKASATEHLLDVDLHSGNARGLLMRIGGIKDDE